MPSFELRLRTDRLRKYRELVGLVNTTEFANRVGVSRHTADRMINQVGVPSQRFIAGLLHTFKPFGFDEFFEVIPATATNEEIGEDAGIHILAEDADTIDVDIEGAA